MNVLARKQRNLFESLYLITNYSSIFNQFSRTFDMKKKTTGVKAMVLNHLIHIEVSLIGTRLSRLDDFLLH